MERKYSTAEVKVRYAETDMMGVVYHANYLIWLELGRESFLQQMLGKDYIELENKNIVSPVVSVQLKYLASAKYGDTVTIRTCVSKVTPIRVTYCYELLNETGVLLVKAETELVCVTREDFKVVNMKKVLPDWYNGYQAYLKANT